MPVIMPGHRYTISGCYECRSLACGWRQPALGSFCSILHHKPSALLWFKVLVEFDFVRLSHPILGKGLVIALYPPFKRLPTSFNHRSLIIL